MAWETIVKRIEDLVPRPNLEDYESEYRSFTWDDARAGLNGLPEGGGLNIGYEAVDRHARGPRADRVALRFLGKDLEARDLTYADLRAQTARFANVLKALGVGAGERVFALCGRIPELYVSALGTLKAGAVFSPLFSAFGPEPIRQRLDIGDARVLVTTEAFYRRKVVPIRDALPRLEHVLLVGEVPEERSLGFRSLEALMAEADDRYEMSATDPEQMALLHFTSGTTGTPKGAVHVHEAVVAHHATGRYALDFHDDDVFWCTADPGWVTGTSYGIISPLTHGITTVVDEAEFDPERWYRILAEEGVTVWYTAPTAVRRMMRLGSDVAREYEFPRLRFIASVGEPLNPEAVVWGQEAFGLPIHDNWWQTETGGIMIANYAAMDVRPGSMGKPLPGVEAAILRRDGHGDPALRDGEPVLVDDPEEQGELVLRVGWPSMFRGYLHEEERYRKCFVGDWYRTGDLARRDADGYFWFVGRADDVIKSAGHLIGPFEVESALMEHPAVAEVGVIGMPDPLVGEVVKAFVILRHGLEPSDAVGREIMGFGRSRLGPVVAPKQIEIVDALPRTRSGKIMRRLLKARELGLPEGDLSTLENP